MAMTKKHYEIVAGEIARAYTVLADTEHAKTVVYLLAKRLAEQLYLNDNNFNDDKFLKECGL